MTTGAIGVALAYLRRYSAKQKKYWEIIGLRLGLNTLVATVVGGLFALLLLTRSPFYGLLGPLVVFGGFAFDGMWELFHDLALRILSGENREVLLAEEIRHYLLTHPQLGDVDLESVEVRHGSEVRGRIARCVKRLLTP